MSELKICQDILDVPDLHVSFVPLHVAQRFQLRTSKQYDVAGFEICWLAVVQDGFTKSLYRIEVAENLDRKVMNLRRMAGALLEINDALFAVIGREFKNVCRMNHIQAINFKDGCEHDVFICQSEPRTSYLEDYWRPRQSIRNLTEYQSWVKSNRPENLRHFQLHVPHAVWAVVGTRLRRLGFSPTYRLTRVEQ